MIHLCDLEYRGCISCFRCKRYGAQPCHCYLNDTLSPVLDKVLHANVLLLGSPIYFRDVTGQMRSFLERLGFITLTYDDLERTLFEGHISTVFFYTMNADIRAANTPEYQMIYRQNLRPLRRLGGNCEYYAIYDTLQFNNYSLYHTKGIDAAHKAEVRARQFPTDLDAAYRVGFKLTEQKL